jgi:phosphatidylinositol alpha-mannosyltransferase
MKAKSEKLSVGFLFDDTLDSNDGVAQQVKRLGEFFSQNGHHVVYLCGQTRMESWAGGKVYSLAKNIRISFNGNRLSMPLLSHASAIKAVLEAEKLDILHVQVPYSPLMAQRVIKRAHKTSAIVGTFHILPSGLLAASGSRLLGLAQWLSLKKFDAMISVSSSAGEFAKRNFGISSTIIPNMIDLKSFNKMSTNVVTDEKIVFLGRLVKRKGCAELIKAFALLSRDQPLAKLVIAGDGAERPALEKLVDKLELRQKVQFLGFIKEEDKVGLLGSAAIACFPSLYGESFGVVLIEAMAAGAGVVLAGANPGYRTVMEDQPKMLIDPRDTNAFADRLTELLKDEKEAAKIHTWQDQHVKKYDVNVVGEQVLNVYRQAFAKHRLKRHN